MGKTNGGYKKTRKLIPIILTVFSMLILIPNVYASESVDLSELDQRLGEALGIGETAGGVLASTLMLAIFLFPLFVILRGKDNQFFALLVFGLPILCTSVMVGWLPFWILLMICVLTALIFAGKMRGLIGGR